MHKAAASMPRGLLTLGWLATMLVGSACAPQSAPRGEMIERAGPPKVLTVAGSESKVLVTGFGTDGLAVENDTFWHRLLTRRDGSGDRIAGVAAELISTEKGTWRVNADGTMDTTWKLRPGLTWHDGAAFTAGDVLFTFRVYQAPEAGPPEGAARQLMKSAVALDDLTVSIHWSGVYVDADRAPNLWPLPKHLLEERFDRGWDQFASSPALSSEFVGLGPYRLVSWIPGSHMEGEAFAEFYEGRPRIDRLIVRFLADANTRTANLLSGTVDVISGTGELALQAETEWRERGLRVAYNHGGLLALIEFQFRPEHARPINGARNLFVRQALYHATDRHLYVEVLTAGKAVVSDSWIGSRDPLRPQMEAWIPQFPYDLRRAQQLLAEAGWAPGADGVLVHQPSEERFRMVIDGSEQAGGVIADMWKAVGVEPQQRIQSEPTAEERSLIPGARQGSLQQRGFYGGRLYYHSREISAPENRWAGANRTGYQNPRVDAILDRLVTIIEPAPRLAVYRELSQTLLTDVPLIPLHVGVGAIIYHDSVTGIVDQLPANNWDFNIHEWDKR